MWLMLNDCFLSIVSKDCRPDELQVRARRHGDIEKVFPNVRVVRTPAPADYRYRAIVAREDIAAALASEVNRIEYDNFKNSVRDDNLHDAYMAVWIAMLRIEQAAPRKRNRKTRAS